MEPIRVMVVDDAADARFLITLVLGDAAGIEVVAQADGAEAALALLDDHDPDLVLVDARMPVMDGYELTRTLLARRPGLRVAVLTSIVDGVIEAEASRAGAAACWSKAEVNRLPDAILTLLGRPGG